MHRHRLAALLLTLTSPFLGGAPAAAQQASTDTWSTLQYRHVGPIGNRVSAVSGVPGDANTYLVGAASGGVWKTTNGGITWRPTFDGQPVQSIGSLAIAPSDPNVVWAGTGESFIRSNVVVGNGVYRSLDGGETWRNMGLALSGRVGRILVHPRDPETVWVAALGHLYGPQQERGVYKTTDGGATWQRVLFVDENTGAVDIAIDPGNPRTLYAAMWQMQIWTWGRESGGPGGGIHRSTDGGETWVQLTAGGTPKGAPAPAAGGGRGTVRSADGIVGKDASGLGRGLPTGVLGKIGLALSAANPARVYALVETSAHADFAPIDDIGVLWRSDDRGATWELISRDHTLTQRPLYYTRAAVAPDDADEIHFMAVIHGRSIDGGRNIERGGGGGDNHDMWIDPLLPDRMVIGHDGGVSISTDRGHSWFRPYLPIAQMYHVNTDDQIPYNLYGNRQDGASFAGPSRVLGGGGIASSAWHSVGGCESGWAIPDPAGTVVYSGCYEGILDRWDAGTGVSQNISVWPDNPEGWPAGELRYRFQWTFPVLMSPHNSSVVYAGSQHVHRTTDGGRSWQVISPDLTTNDKELQHKTGGLTPDDASPTYAAVLFAVAESRRERGVLWAGSNDGTLHVSRDGGGSWTHVSGRLPGLPALGTMSAIEPSRHADGKAYLAVDTHQVNSTEPWLFRTDDYGQSWTRIVAGIPDGPLSYTHVIREDPVRPGLLYAGTGNALYVSFDDGANWQPLQQNLPHAPVHWLTVQERFNDLVVATYGRGFWILDDITPLQQLDATVLASDAHLFRPRAAYRFLRPEGHVSANSDPAAGDNPAYGASLAYYLSEARAGAQVKVEIVDGAGAVVRNLGGPTQAGINRTTWDLRVEPSRSPRLRTQPLEHAHAEINDQGWRPLVEGGRVAPLAPPGMYTVRLTVGETSQEMPLEVLQDPASQGTAASIAAQTEHLMAIRDEVNEVVDFIDELEWLRKQIGDLRPRLRARDDEAIAAVRSAAEELESKLTAAEGVFFDLRLTGGTAFQDSLRWPRRLFAKLNSLAGYMSGTDFAPTAQQIEVHELYRQQLAEVRERVQALRQDVTAFNAKLRDAGIVVIGAPPADAGSDRAR